MKPLLVLALFALASATCAHAESVYTKLNIDQCKTLEEEGDSIRALCKGWGGYPVEFSEGDLRQSLFVGHLGP